MRKKLTGHLRAVLEGMMVIGFGIQIVMGAVWLCGNFLTLQDFAKHDSIFYTLLTDLSFGLPQILCVIQLLAAYVCVYRFWNAWKGGCRWSNAFRTLAVMSLPMALQSHLAILPWSLVGSSLILQWSFACELLRGDYRSVFGKCLEPPESAKKVGGRRAWYRSGGMLLAWLAMALLLPEYRFLGGVTPLVVGVVCAFRMRREWKRLLVRVLLFAVCTTVIFGAGTFVRGEKRPLALAMLSRMAWTHVLQDYPGWPEEVLLALGESARDLTYEAGNFDRILWPALVQAYGEEQAKAYCEAIAKEAFEDRLPVLLTYFRWDAFAYAFSPLYVQDQLEGAYYDSYTGRNYDIMSRQMPAFTKIYWDYACWWYGVALLLGLLGGCLKCLAGACRKWDFAVLFAILASGGMQVVWYTMRGSGMMDYKATFVVASLWILFALSAFFDQMNGCHFGGNEIEEQ